MKPNTYATSTSTSSTAASGADKELPITDADSSLRQHKKLTLQGWICFYDIDDHFPKDLLVPAQAILKSYKLPGGPRAGSASSTAKVKAFDRDTVRRELSDLLPSSSNCLSAESLAKPLLPIRLLHDIATLYDIQDIDPVFVDEVKMSTIEQNHGGMQAVLFLAFIIGLEPEAARIVLDTFREVRMYNPRQSTVQEELLGRRDENVQDGSRPSMPRRNTVGDQNVLHTEPVIDPASLNSTAAEVLATAPVLPAQGSEHISVADLQGGNMHGVTSRLQNFDQNLALKQSSYINSYFSNRRFKGTLEDSIELTLQEYEQCSIQYSLNENQRAALFINVLDYPARTFFLTNFRPGMSFLEIKAMMVKEYNSNSRQIQVRRALQSLRFDAPS